MSARSCQARPRRLPPRAAPDRGRSANGTKGDRRARPGGAEGPITRGSLAASVEHGMRRLLITLGCLLCLVGAVRPVPSLAQSLPNRIDPDTFGAKTFDERWDRLDASEMAKRPAAPTRWRTVLGAGDPSKAVYRTGSGSSVYVDETFAGVANGQVLDKPLGLNPFRIDPGASLTIVGSRTPAALLPIVFDRPYLGGVLTTKFSFSQLFGYFEIRAKLPVGKGFWPAFWLLPIRGTWPQNGELDVFEGLGEPDQIHAGIISGADHLSSSVPVKLPFKVGGAGADWHTYGVAWSSDEIVWYVDRSEVRRVRTPSDMKQVPMYLLLNLAIGGKWGGWPDETTPWPGEFIIGRVSAWKLPG